MGRALVFIVAILLILTGIYFYMQSGTKSVPELESESGDMSGIEGWETKQDFATQVSYQYPVDFGTTYLKPVDWPPMLQIIDEEYACTAGGGSEALPGGMTEEIATAGNTYCVTREGEGAAGSVYTSYAYAFPYGARTAILTFSMRQPQCVNYDDPQRTDCQAELDAFSPDGLVDRIAGSIAPLK